MAMVKEVKEVKPTKVVAVPPQFIEKAKQLKKLIEAHDEKAEVAAAAKKAVRDAQIALAKDMQRAKLKNFNVEGVGPVFVATEYHPKVLDKMALDTFLKKDKEGKKLFKMTANGKTVTAFLVERFKGKGKLPPATVVDIARYVEAVARIRSEKGEDE